MDLRQVAGKGPAPLWVVPWLHTWRVPAHLRVVVPRVAQQPEEQPERLGHVPQVGGLSVEKEVQHHLLQLALPLLQARDRTPLEQ